MAYIGGLGESGAIFFFSVCDKRKTFPSENTAFSFSILFFVCILTHSLSLIPSIRLTGRDGEPHKHTLHGRAFFSILMFSF